jgi:hypothetical protein
MDEFMVRQLLASAPDEASRADLRRLCANAVAATAARLAVLSAATASTSLTMLAHELHGMKGMLASVGLSGVAAGVATLERGLAREGTIDRELCRQLQAAVTGAGARLLARL